MEKVTVALTALGRCGDDRDVALCGSATVLFWPGPAIDPVRADCCRPIPQKLRAVRDRKRLPWDDVGLPEDQSVSRAAGVFALAACRVFACVSALAA